MKRKKSYYAVTKPSGKLIFESAQLPIFYSRKVARKYAKDFGAIILRIDHDALQDFLINKTVPTK